MANRADLVPWVFQAVKELGGEASVKDVAKAIWKNHEADLKKDNLFYTWQYDMRWAAQKLRDEKKFVSAKGQKNRKWAIAR
jgi:hypothetical protein